MQRWSDSDSFVDTIVWKGRIIVLNRLKELGKSENTTIWKKFRFFSLQFKRFWVIRHSIKEFMICRLVIVKKELMEKYINYLLLVVVLISACQPNEDVTSVTVNPPESVEVTEMELKGHVTEPFSLYSSLANLLQIHNATVQLIYEDEVLDEVRTNERGQFAFSPQIVPVEGAYLLATAPGYYPNSFKIDSIANDFHFGYSYFPLYLLRPSNENFSGEAVTSAEHKIVITGSLQSPSRADGGIFYFTTDENELAGTYTSDASMDFAITTVANETLHFYYRYADCDSPEPITMGPFSDDTDIGVLFDENEPLFDPPLIIDGMASTCSGSPANGYILLKRNHKTIFSFGTLNNGRFWGQEEDCQFEISPEIRITAITSDPRMYGEVTLTYTPGQLLEPVIAICSEDDTYFKYAIDNGTEMDRNAFTVANILPDGRAIIKQIDPGIGNYRNTSLEIAGAEMSGDYLGYLVNFKSGSTIHFAVQDVAVHINLNDGEFIEGILDGIAVAPFEEVMGSFSGSFRARIQ